MRRGYARISKTDGSQGLDVQKDALIEAGVDTPHIDEEHASGTHANRPGLTSCLKALREGDILVVWKRARLGRDLKHWVTTVQEWAARGIGCKVLVGPGADIETMTASGKLVGGIFAAWAEFERAFIRERTLAGLQAARARGRKGGRKCGLSKAQVRRAQAARRHRDPQVSDLCEAWGSTRVTLYRDVSPNGALREHGRKVLLQGSAHPGPPLTQRRLHGSDPS